jgi:solute carrier family 12 sodium/potassium/chloride transporter 2
MSLISAFSPLNYLGCISATFSSALSEFVSCPELLKVIAADNLYPYWMVGFFGIGYGKSKQPVNAIAFTFLLSLAFVLIGNILTFSVKVKNQRLSFFF